MNFSPISRRSYFPHRVLCAGLLLATPLLYGTSRLRAQPTEKPQPVLQLGHARAVNSLSFSPDGSTLATVSADRSLKLWDTRSGGLKASLNDLGTIPSAVKYSPDGKTVAVVGTSRGDELNTPMLGLTLVDAHTAKIRQFPTPSSAYSLEALAYSPNGRRIAAVGGSTSDHTRTLVIWNAETGTVLQTIKEMGSAAFAVAFTPDGKTVITSGDGANILFRDAQTGKVIRTIKGAGKQLFAVAVSPDGQAVATVGVTSKEMVAGSDIQLRDIKTGQVKTTMQQAGIVRSVTFSPDGKSLVSSGAMMGLCEIKVWDTSTGKERRTFRGRDDYFCPSAVSPDGKMAAAGSTVAVSSWEAARTTKYFIGDVQLWNLGTGRPSHQLRGYDAPVQQIQFARNGLLAVSSASWRQPNRISVVLPDGKVSSLSGEAPFALTPDGQKIFARDTFNKTVPITFVDNKGRKTAGKITEPRPCLTLRETRTGRVLRTISSPSAQNANAVAVSANGNQVLYQTFHSTPSTEYPIKSWGELFIHDSKTGKLLRKLRTVSGYGVSPIQLSPNSTVLATGGSVSGEQESGVVQLWQLSSGKLIRTLRLPSSMNTSMDGVEYLTWSPSGQFIAGRSTFGICWWEASSGRVVRLLKSTGHIGTEHLSFGYADSSPIAFSPDGKLLASETGGSSIRLWDVRTGKLVKELWGHTGAVLTLAFAPSGKTLLSGGYDNEIRIWDIGTGQQKGQLRFLPPSGKGVHPEWLITTPQSEIEMSSGAGQHIRWWTGSESRQSVPESWKVRAGLLKSLLGG